MAVFMNTYQTHLAPVFAAVSVLAGRRKSKSKAKRSGGGSGKGNKLKGLVQYTDVDEDKIVRLARRKTMASKHVAASAAPMAVWIRVVTDYGKTIMMNADQFEAGGVQGVASATPHFS